MKHLLFLLFILTFTKAVFSLKCYATDLSKLQKGDVETTVQDCRENIEQILKMQGQSAAHIPPNVPFRCYKVTASGDSITMAIKGCIPEGGCKLMKPIFHSLLDMGRSNAVQDLSCDECYSDMCNSGTLLYNSVTRNTFYFVILGFILFAVAM